MTSNVDCLSTLYSRPGDRLYRPQVEPQSLIRILLLLNVKLPDFPDMYPPSILHIIKGRPFGVGLECLAHSLQERNTLYD